MPGDRAALIVGGASGIGAEVAQLLATRGSSIVVADFDEDKGPLVADAIVAGGGNASFIRVDVGDPTSADAAVRYVCDTYGGLDLAFNSAGVFLSPALFHETDDRTWLRTIEVNLLGLVWCLRAEIAVMLERGGGAVVNASSGAGLRGSPHAAPYAASKHAVVGITRTVAMEYARSNIRVNAIAPSMVDTPMTAGLSEEERASRVSKSAMGRFGTTSEVANVVAFLLSDEASLVNGSTYTVDGGGGPF